MWNTIPFCDEREFVPSLHHLVVVISHPGFPAAHWNFPKWEEPLSRISLIIPIIRMPDWRSWWESAWHPSCGASHGWILLCKPHASTSHLVFPYHLKLHQAEILVWINREGYLFMAPECLPVKLGLLLRDPLFLVSYNQVAYPHA